MRPSRRCWLCALMTCAQSPSSAKVVMLNTMVWYGGTDIQEASLTCCCPSAGICVMCSSHVTVHSHATFACVKTFLPIAKPWMLKNNSPHTTGHDIASKPKNTERRQPHFDIHAYGPSIPDGVTLQCVSTISSRKESRHSHHPSSLAKIILRTGTL